MSFSNEVNILCGVAGTNSLEWLDEISPCTKWDLSQPGISTLHPTSAPNRYLFTTLNYIQNINAE